MDTFRAFRIHSENDEIAARVEEISLDDLNDGEVVIKCAWSCVNYKDALAATGAGKILRTYPLVGGIDVAGTVVSSTDDRYREGDEVVVTSAGLSETRDGGYAEYARLAGDSVIPLPEGFTTRDAMILGTAGFTAALAVHRMEQNGQKPGNGPIAVSGATGGVGSVAIDLLAGRGYEVHAISSKVDAVDYLKGLGAAEVIAPAEIDFGSRPLEKAVWAGAVDNLGGDMLGWFTRTTKYGGNVASIGLAASHKLEATVMPFILRGVNLLGINAVDTPRDLRLEVWGRLATDLRPQRLEHIVNGEVGLDDLAEGMQDWLDGKVTGRRLVKLAG
ncbi:MAG: oxidoreductase [Gammaproteobacteria bacterium]|jgi:NADPH2:quinone reductase|nr:oxidoreductase [Gammaproteobacteria bacterium]MDP7094106.1 oxidoreductase [Gammaproteobacteria bacterium]MDP7270965.1 oxidoreductase [Gammaproteobacteria bacterium]HJP05408.1 oxidoreductase [Gammaproteobacteria bacterium]